MEIINAHNICLRAARLARIASPNTYDPSVSEVQPHIDDAKREILRNGYEFNTEQMTLSPNNDDKISVDGYVNVYLPAGYENLIVKNGFLWDRQLRVYHSTEIANAMVVLDKVWDNIPDEFQEWISYKAAAGFAAQLLGPDSPEAQKAAMTEVDYACRAEGMYHYDFGTTTGYYKVIASYDF
jgi:hypothetical protein